MNNTDARNMGHGHVTPRPDGYRSRCGGPAICVVCQAERAAFEATTQPPQDERGQGEYRQNLINWVVERWHAEVANRPMVNVHRRALDDTWRQMLRHLSVDDRERLGPTHDELREKIGGKEWSAMMAIPSQPMPTIKDSLNVPSLSEWPECKKCGGNLWQCMACHPTAAQPVALSTLADIRAILYQCDRGNVSLSWLIDALRGIVERAASVQVQPVGEEGDRLIALAEKCSAEVGRHEGDVMWVKFHSRSSVEAFAAGIVMSAAVRSHAAASAPAQQATQPQPVAAEVVTAPKLLLERAAEMCEWYAEFIRENVMSVDIERHPYRPELEGIAEDLRALSGTGSDKSAKENGNG